MARHDERRQLARRAPGRPVRWAVEDPVGACGRRSSGTRRARRPRRRPGRGGGRDERRTAVQAPVARSIRTIARNIVRRRDDRHGLAAADGEPGAISVNGRSTTVGRPPPRVEAPEAVARRPRARWRRSSRRRRSRTRRSPKTQSGTRTRPRRRRSATRAARRPSGGGRSTRPARSRRRGCPSGAQRGCAVHVVGVAGDDRGAGRAAVRVDVRDHALGPVPGQVRVVPAEPREASPSGASRGDGDEVAARRRARRPRPGRRPPSRRAGSRRSCSRPRRDPCDPRGRRGSGRAPRPAQVRVAERPSGVSGVPDRSGATRRSRPVAKSETTTRSPAARYGCAAVLVHAGPDVDARPG